MNRADVDARIAAIKKCAGDWESTHSDSDDLLTAVLEAIAAGTAEDPAGLARYVVDEIEALDFPRWYA